MDDRKYIGRFAPSPTGPLHFGSLVAAVASYLDAKHNDGKWLVRIEDLDKPREVPGAAANILQTLEAYGFEWDAEVIYQSQRHALYQSALEQLIDQGMVYPCNCSRREIADIAHAGIEGLVYNGQCRDGLSSHREQQAWRVKLINDVIEIDDAIQGIHVHHMFRDIGDFVLKRADGLFAYQLAVVVDDAAQDITDVVRGCDLLNSTSRQIHLQQLLAYPYLRYAHIPVVVDSHGQKLSKQTYATPINTIQSSSTLLKAFTFLDLDCKDLSESDSLDVIWQWGIENWHHPKATKPSSNQ